MAAVATRISQRPWPARLRRLLCLLLYTPLAIFLMLLLPEIGSAGGPRYVAGVSYFDPATKGTPVTWAQGSISYYTDQGDLSPLLLHAAADLFVANAFSRWTSIPTAAVATTLAGQLGEDVNGTNVIANGNGTFTMPSDILPTAVNKACGDRVRQRWGDHQRVAWLWRRQYFVLFYQLGVRRS